MMDEADFNGRDAKGTPEQVPAAKMIGRCIMGWLVGYLISALSSILLFTIARIEPHQPASPAIIWLTAIYSVIFTVIGGALGASVCRRFALGIGAAIALTIGAVAMWSWWATPKDSHWTHAVAILLLMPAAQFGSFLRRSDI